MATSSSSASAIYLAKQGNELVLRQGENPNQLKHTDQRVLIIGGGVTGLTVSIFDFRLLCLFAHREHNVDRVGPTGRRLLSDCRVRAMGITGRSYNLPDCRSTVSTITIDIKCDANHTFVAGSGHLPSVGGTLISSP